MSAPSPTPGLADRFSLIIGGLCRAAAATFATDRSIGPLLILLTGRLQRMARNFAALAARAKVGPLPSPRRRAENRTLRERKSPLPQGFGWLVRLVGSEAACFGSQLQHLLSDPEMAVLLKAAPQAGRIFRPLCRMLGQKPDPAILAPPPPRQARAPSAGPAALAEKPAPTEPTRAEPTRAEPPRTEPYRRKPVRTEPGVVWRRWRDIWLPQPIRPILPT